MRLLTSLLLPAIAAGAGLPHFAVLADEPGAWPHILGAVGFQQKPPAEASVFVFRAGAAASAEWPARVERGAVLIIEGESSMAEAFGFRRTGQNVRVASVSDVHDPEVPIVWERALEMPRFAVPAGAKVFARERWDGAPLVAGLRRGAGAVLWVALEPGERGYERFPFLLQAFADLGLQPAFASSRLWAFFDYSYRVRVDPEYFADRWRDAGIAALHVAAWHFFEPDPERDRYLTDLARACHARGIQVYAWLELPHVSERFWNDHPEWREKTALGQDAQLDWRKLMNLQNRACFRAVAAGIRKLLERFDWDGVNIAELYFESLDGLSNPSRFTPMNADVRAEFRQAQGFDPVEIFAGRRDERSRRLFLDFRAALARRMQQEWLGVLEESRRERPHLDLVLTHVDDRFDSQMRDAIGADAGSVLPLLDTQSFTFLVEDPATVWHLGPQRYPEIARRYQALTPRHDRLGVDINIVERYQNVYPTKQQTGTELFQLVHAASGAFARVALYFENSLRKADLPLLPAAAASVSRVETVGGKLMVDSPAGVGLRWNGAALVDGRPWPVRNGKVLWLAAGAHSIENAAHAPGPAVLHFNGDLQAARYAGEGCIELAYRSQARAYAVLDRRPAAVEVDGATVQPELYSAATIALPRGQHLVTIRTQ